jgi:hypothetical protein
VRPISVTLQSGEVPLKSSKTLNVFASVFIVSALAAPFDVGDAI